MVTKLIEKYQKWGLKVNSTKPLYLVFNVCNQNIDITENIDFAMIKSKLDFYSS